MISAYILAPLGQSFESKLITLMYFGSIFTFLIEPVGVSQVDPGTLKSIHILYQSIFAKRLRKQTLDTIKGLK